MCCGDRLRPPPEADVSSCGCFVLPPTSLLNNQKNGKAADRPFNGLRVLSFPSRYFVSTAHRHCTVEGPEYSHDNPDVAYRFPRSLSARVAFGCFGQWNLIVSCRVARVRIMRAKANQSRF